MADASTSTTTSSSYRNVDDESRSYEYDEIDYQKKTPNNLETTNISSSSSSSSPLRSRRLLWNTIVLIGLLVSWIAQSEIARELETTKGYDKPAFIVWINHTWSMFLLPIQWCLVRLRRRPCPFEEEEEEDSSSPRAGLLRDNIETSSMFQGLTWDIGLKICSGLSISLWIADYVWYIGLSYATVAVATAVFNSSCVFVCVFSYLMMGKTPSSFAIGALMITYVL